MISTTTITNNHHHHPILRILKILFSSHNNKTNNDNNSLLYPLIDIFYVLVLITAKAKSAEILSETARIRLSKFGTSGLSSALISYAVSVVALSPIDVLFNNILRNVQARFAHRLVIELNSQCVGSTKFDHSIITDSADKFVDLALNLTIEFMEGIAHLFVFYKILHQLNPIMARACVLTSIGGTIISMMLSARLPQLFHNEQIASSNFSYHLVRTKENAESIQFYGGREAEVKEANMLDIKRQTTIRKRKFAKDQVEQFSKLLRSLAGGIIPIWLSSNNFQQEEENQNPTSILKTNFTHGKMGIIGNNNDSSSSSGIGNSTHSHDHDHDNDSRETSSRLVQASEAFDEILLHLLIFSENAHDISRLTTCAEEIIQAIDTSEFNPFVQQQQQLLLPHVTLEKRTINDDDGSQNIWLSAHNLSINIPDNRDQFLIRNLSFELKYGETLLISGASGSGKTALLRVLSGLWKQGSGQVCRPMDDEIMFLPQKPYCVGGSLADEVSYPKSRNMNQDQEILHALERVGLSHILERGKGEKHGSNKLERISKWAEELSLGEQQRLAFARVVLHRPRFVCCDESSSALDVHSEALMYTMLEEICTGGYISVGHRQSIERFHAKKIVLEGVGNGGKWNVEF
jgi:putative ATP-binding cassette transporter